MWCKPVWLKSSTAARWPACLLCFPNPYRHRISIRINRERDARHHLVVWQVRPIPLRVTMNHWSPYSKKKFTSHPSVCSECGWPFKSTTLKYNTRKVHSCILQMHWAGHIRRPLMECKGSSVRFVHLRQLIMKSIVKLNRRNEMFSVNKLLQMVIFRNLSLLSS